MTLLLTGVVGALALLNGPARLQAGAVSPASAQAVGSPRPTLTAAPQIARVYEAIFDARFAEIPAMLEQTCPPGPDQVCTLLGALATWWEVQLDPDDRSRDPLLEDQVNAAIAAMEGWTDREPARAEAWFYLGGAYGARAQWRVLRGERLDAARDGKRIKVALERALALDPNLQDAYFGIGLYHYYADVAPAAAKVLRWLLALPGGDRVEGLQEMLRARRGGQLLRGEADYQLHLIYLWYEHQTDRALQLLHALRTRHPRNPLFPQLVAEIEDVYLHDPAASLRTWTDLLDAAQRGQVAKPRLAKARAHLGMARQLDRLFETDVAIDHLRAVIADAPPAPIGAIAQAQLQLGQALDRLGHRADAMTAYRAAMAAAPDDDPQEREDRARDGLHSAPTASVAMAYRLSLEGWRALQRGQLDVAAARLSQSLRLDPDAAVTRYRQARLLVARKQDTAAIDLLESIVNDRQSVPPTFHAAACLDAARLHEQRGAPTRALELYRLAATADGADHATRSAARRAVDRLTK